MITTTQRLNIENATLEDGLFFLKLMNSQNWLTHIGDRGIRSEDSAKEYVQTNLLDSYKSKGYGLYKITLKNKATPIGICGFVKREYLQHADIGFAILPEFEGNGYIFEAATAIMHYGATHLRLHPILGVTTADNLRSRKLLHKIGLRQIDTIKPLESTQEFLLFSDA